MNKLSSAKKRFLIPMGICLILACNNDNTKNHDTESDQDGFKVLAIMFSGWSVIGEDLVS